MIGFALLVAHLLGDYLWQNDWIAQKKVFDRDDPKTFSPIACLLHVFLYTLACFGCVELVNHALGNEMWPIWAWVIIAITHYFIDRYRLASVWMNYSGQKGFKEHMGPWSIIIVDNTFHLLISFAVALLVLAQ